MADEAMSAETATVKDCMVSVLCVFVIVIVCVGSTNLQKACCAVFLMCLMLVLVSYGDCAQNGSL